MWLYVIGLGYLVGSFPTAFLAGKRKKIDIRKHGSGNVGATNSFRVLGKVSGTIVLLIDIGKGFFFVYSVQTLIPQSDAKLYLEVVAAGMVPLGHMFPAWLNFKGGKGVATFSGVLLAISPLQVLIAGLIFFCTLYITRYVSLGSILAVSTLPVTFFLFFDLNDSAPVFIFFVILTVLILLLHIKNINRIASGTESRIDNYVR